MVSSVVEAAVGEGSGGAWNAAMERRSGNAGQWECDVGKRRYGSTYSRRSSGQWRWFVGKESDDCLDGAVGDLNRSRADQFGLQCGEVAVVQCQFELGDGGAQARAAEGRGLSGSIR